MQIIVRGLMVHYERCGTGKTVILLPGWADTTASWRTTSKDLGRDYDVVAVDLPGFGGTAAGDGNWNLTSLAGLVAALISKLQLTPYAIIGHSNGGAIAMRLLAGHNPVAERLVLVASAGIRSERVGRKKVLAALTKTAKLLTAPLPQAVQRSLKQKLYRATGSDELVAEHMQLTFRNIVSDDISASSRQVTVPALLLYGERDDQTPVRHGEILQSLLPDAKLITIADCGHFVQLDQPARMLHAIREFL